MDSEISIVIASGVGKSRVSVRETGESSVGGMHKPLDHHLKLRRARHKRRRQRRNAGIAVAPVEFDWDDIELLIALGCLAREDSDDRLKVGEAIRRMLKNVDRSAAPGVLRKW